jgi:starvation-inducible outer membrane lipoprotein
MKVAALVVSLTLWFTLGACNGPMFPRPVIKDVAPDFDFKAWKHGRYELSSQAGGFPGKVQVGGEIVAVEHKSDLMLIVADRLPIFEHPKYGPRKVSRELDSLFAIEFEKITDPTWLQRGNFFIVIGKPEGFKRVLVDDVAQHEPYLVAECIHIWKNQGRDIASFPFETGAGYYPLEEQTFCQSAPRQQ